MRHSIITIGKNAVTKTAAPELMLVEVEKTRRAHEIGKDCGLFRVPEVLEYDKTTGTAVFERLDVKPVSSAIPWGNDRNALVESLGTSLAIIHRNLILPEDMLVPLPSDFSLPHDEVFLHGDVSVDNVCVGNSWPPLIIIDWQMTPKYGGRATFGTRYFDILWFINNLINRPSNRFIFSNPVSPVIRVFIASYIHEAQLPFNGEEFSKYAKHFFEVVTPKVKQEIFRKSKGRARLLWPFSQSILREFLDSLKTMDFNN